MIMGSVISTTNTDGRLVLPVSVEVREGTKKYLILRPYSPELTPLDRYNAHFLEY